MTHPCSTCGKPVPHTQSHINRSLKSGWNLYCSDECESANRKKSIAYKKEVKRLYDQRRRITHAEQLKREKADYHKRTYDPEKQRRYNQEHMAHHVEYCRRPEYVEYKREYDAEYRAKKQYGDYWEAFVLLLKVEQEVKEREDKVSIATINGTLNKKQTRRREYERTHGYQPQGCVVGNSEWDTEQFDAPSAR